jgi:chorismate dehydratase
VSRLRIATVPYLNAVPLIRGLSDLASRAGTEIEIVPIPPSRIAGLLRRGEADAGLVPVIELPGLGHPAIVRGLGIASRRRARSVLLVTRGGLESVRRVALDASSRTSAALVRLLLARRGLREIEFVERPPDWPAMLEGADAALVIGDPALTADLTGLQAIDLATEWFAATGLPFVFAVWAVRDGVRLPDDGALFHEALRRGEQEIDTIAQEASARLGRPSDDLASYLRECIHYRLGPAEERALALFLARAHEIGLVPRPEPLRFTGPKTAPAPVRGIA